MNLHRLHRLFGGYTVGVLAFVALLSLLEQAGLSRDWIGLSFLVVTIGTYAAIGVISRTTEPDEYYVAGRRVPAIYNGMATAADWFSAASFIGLAGTLYMQGFGGLAFVLGWTGGYCLVALLLAPYLRKFGQYTVADFLAERYGGNGPRMVAILASLLCSFTYVVAQIYGVGLVTARLTGVAFEVGVFLGVGGILVCSFLGGMRAVTWTQVAQFVVMVLAYTLPVVWLSVKQTSVPVPQAVVGYQLEKLTRLEQQLLIDTKELEVRRIYRDTAIELEGKLSNPQAALDVDKAQAEATLERLLASDALPADISLAERKLASLPKDATAAVTQWGRQLDEAKQKTEGLNGMPLHAKPFAGDPNGTPEEQAVFDVSRRNFMALVFCLMLGTASLPHILMRFYTVSSVQEARDSVSWTMVFIALLYLTAPALAVLVKFEIFSELVGTSFAALPAWVTSWARVDPSLLSVKDVNGDGILQLNELSIGADIIVLATAEIAGLPYVVAGLVAAGGMAAALSTADGLLLTIANALSHDLYYKMIDPQVSTARRVTVSKVLLLMVSLAAAYVAAQKPANILFLVSAAFSLAASAFFPALVLGIFWKRATAPAALLGMVSGLGVTTYYVATTQPWLRDVFGITQPVRLWWGIDPISAGVFGVPVGFAVIVLVSWLTPSPPKSTQTMVQNLRFAMHEHPDDA